MNTKFNVGDKVAAIGTVTSIHVTEKGTEEYDVTFTSYEDYRRTETFRADQIFHGSDLILEEDDLK